MKIGELMIRNKLIKHFEQNSLLSENQHGFRHQRSCITQLLSHTSFIFSNLVEGNDVDCIYIDYAKAFDKVDHSILLQKLKQYGITHKYLTWIRSFLSNRFQTVYNNGTCSFTTPVLSGVPQGSVLGPLLFILFINDLQDVISRVNLLTFADDTKLISKINSSTDVTNLQNNINSIIQWSNKNNMKLNPNKFEHISHKSQTHRKHLENFETLPFSKKHSQYYADNFLEISRSNCVRDLGVLIDENLNFKIQINTLHKVCRQLCGWIFSVFHTRNRETMLILFKSLIRSKLEYGCEIFNPHQIKEIIAIEQIQRTFTSRIAGMQNYNYWERLVKLKIMSLQRRREMKIIIHLWKIHNKIYPNNININFKSNARTLSTQAIVKPLPRIRGRILTLYDASFTINAARLLNTLPAELTNMTSINLFRNALDPFLLKVPDEPPLLEYHIETTTP